MSLLSAFTNARASLGNISAQSALVSRNIANADNPAATRKYAELVTSATGGARILSVAQSSDPALFRSLLSSNSAASAAGAFADALDRLRDVIGDVDSTTSPAARLSAFETALSRYAVSPEDPQAASAAISTASNLATSLNDASAAAQQARLDADKRLEAAAQTMRGLLSELKTLNDKVIEGSVLRADVTDLKDRRDQVVAELSTYVGLNVQYRANDDLVLYTDSGITLFERVPREISFAAKDAYQAGLVGNAFIIDGVEISGPTSPMPVKSGLLAGLLSLRDETTVKFQEQLDAIATSLVQSFAEVSNADPAGPKFAGLFTDRSGSPTEIVDISSVGLSSRLQINDSVNPQKPGGNPFRLRDGAISHPDDPADPLDADDPNFVYNPTGAAGFTDRVNTLLESFSKRRAFDVTLDAGTNATISVFAANSISWLEDKRSSARADATYSAALNERTRQTLSDRTGVNLDEEMTRLLDLERSYQASSKLLSSVGEMLDSLLAIA